MQMLQGLGVEGLGLRVCGVALDGPLAHFSCYGKGESVALGPT